MVVAALAALVPIIGLILLASDSAFPTPLRFAFAGDSAAPFAPLFRADGLSFYGAWGIAALIAPLLLWIVWMDAGRSTDSTGRLLAELALAIGLEAVALQLVFSDNLLWLGLMWLALAALVWLLGEQGAEGGDFDYLGLACTLIGPAVAMLILLLIAVTTKEHTFYTLTGHSAASPLQIILLAVALTAAGGGYPFVAWVRRRAAFATPSGFAALVLLALPVVIFVGARAWGALQATTGLWPEIGAVTPPITGGIALAVLGALTIAISGLLALGRRDGRTLVALLASAQVGWGLLALGSSQAAAGIGTVVLLATSVVGLGAMLAALIAGGILTADDEPEGAGPAPFGLATRPLNLFAWCVGAATAIGVPFFGGFVARHLITSGALSGTKLGIPLLGLAWLGDALFAVALVRATVLAFKADPDDAAADDVEGAEAEGTATKRPSSTIAELLELPGVALALIAVALGIFPQTFLNMGALFATDQITQEGAADGVLRIVRFGYTTANSQWLPGIFWLAALVLGVVVLLLRLGVHRTAVTLETSGDAELAGMDEDALDEPAVVWIDLASAFTSHWTQVAGKQLIGGIDEDDEYAEALLDEDEDDSDDDGGPDDTNPPDDSDGRAETPNGTAPANGVMAADETAAESSPGSQTPATGRKTTKQGTRNAEKRGQVQK
jgi:formate hydrogenlyase subunit 3/multisubunit Na+/H+ antiporter MnhD subunit